MPFGENSNRFFNTIQFNRRAINGFSCLFGMLFLFCQVLLAAGDTFRAAASDQLEIWADRTGCEIVVAEKENAKAASGELLLSFN